MSSAVYAVNATLALLSGALLGMAFPPVDAKPLVWIGLVPLLWALDRCERPRRAFLLGSLAGFTFFLITLHPLVSAHAWTGWAVETQAQFAARLSRQWWFLHGVWVAFALWGALFWGAWASGVRRVATSHWRTLVAAPALWVLVTEWLRSKTTFNFTWAFLGSATAEWPAIRQLAALGGVWLLSALVVFVNVAVGILAQRKVSGTSKARVALAVIVGVGLAIGYGVLRQLAQPRHEPTMPVAVVQYAKPTYALSDFLPIGLDKTYPQMIREAMAKHSQLIVLPESIALGALSLDGSSSATKPRNRLTSRSQWEAAFQDWLKNSDAAVVLGLDTVEQFHDHNTLVAWTRAGTAGWYHKRGLVPFSEYVPSGWAHIAIRGRSQYSPGQGAQLIRISDGVVLGGFICQEVLRPELIRESVRDGATILVSGGNDGVFADPAVIRIHAEAAQLRAVETGRYLVRAMKTGISAIIDPTGKEIMRSKMGEAVLLTSRVSLERAKTPYVRFGDWVVWLSLAVLIGTLLLPRRLS